MASATSSFEARGTSRSSSALPMPGYVAAFGAALRAAEARRKAGRILDDAGGLVGRGARLWRLGLRAADDYRRPRRLALEDLDELVQRRHGAHL